MGQIIDISSKITNELPMVKITDDLIVTINNRHQNVMSMQCMIKELQKKDDEAKKKAEEEGVPYESEYDELALIDKAIAILTSAKSAKAIKDMNLPLPEYKMVYETIIAAATGTYGETPTE